MSAHASECASEPTHTNENQGDTEHTMETEESLTLPGQANNNHHQQLPDTSSIRNYNSDLQTSLSVTVSQSQFKT